ncbi:hypothetical protein TTRE_0000134701 [Trichuris trichiura]|uniref:Uncharacterized protein n=1 Tax=Trichuris trichiura TaxID=36087 RepID=A0A077YZ92_TRITR|nr:hypothetical protein TTRE_0000134701 [Trichuris trichiura]
MKEYDECMDECRVKEQRSFDMLKEIEKKSDYWKNFNEVKKGMTVKDALIYWKEIRGEFKLLEEANHNMRDELRKRIHKAERVCKEGKCKELQKKLVAGTNPDAFIDLMKEHDKCMEECRATEKRSFSLLSEIDKKADYWKNFNEVKSEMSLEDALVYWTEIQDEFKLLQENEQEFERIERILKPSEADKNMRTELEDQIKKGKKKCSEGPCPEDVIKKEKWAQAVLEEIEKKSDFWQNMKEVRELMSTLDALVYWTEIRDEFIELEKAKLRLTKEEIEQKEELDARIREQDRICKTGECADFRKAILGAQKAKDRVSAADSFFNCMKKCKSVVDQDAEKLEKLHEREDYYKNMEEVREQVSVIAAVQYYDEIKLDIEAAKALLDDQQELALRQELDAHDRDASTYCLLKECASTQPTRYSSTSKPETRTEFKACVHQCKKKALTLTKEELELKKRLENKVAEASIKCQKTKCADQKKQIKDLGFQQLDFKKTDAYFKCLDVCKESVKGLQAKIDQLHSRQQYWINLHSIKDEMSLQHALIYWVEIENDVVF